MGFFFTVFLKNRNIISKIKSSKVTDYAALIFRQKNLGKSVKPDQTAPEGAVWSGFILFAILGGQTNAHTGRHRVCHL